MPYWYIVVDGGLKELFEFLPIANGKGNKN